VEGIAGDPPAFADAQGEQELWEELRSHGAALNRVLNEAEDPRRPRVARLPGELSLFAFPFSSSLRALFVA
jgi:hypothetical protein